MSDYLDDRVSGESYRALESERDTLRNENLSGMQEIDRLKAELEREKPFFDEALLVLKDRDAWKLKAEKAEKQESIVREVSGNRLELWIKAEKKAEKLAEALKSCERILNGYEGLEYIHEIAKEALKESRRCKHGVDGEDCFKCYPSKEFEK